MELSTTERTMYGSSRESVRRVGSVERYGCNRCQQQDDNGKLRRNCELRASNQHDSLTSLPSLSCHLVALQSSGVWSSRIVWASSPVWGTVFFLVSVAVSVC